MLKTACLCTELRRTTRHLTRHYDLALLDVGINVAQFSLLRHLERLGRPSISTLADAMGLDRSTLGRNLRVLESMGLVQLDAGRDQRNREVWLSEESDRRLQAGEKGWARQQAAVMEHLGEDRRAQFVALLQELQRLPQPGDDFSNNPDFSNSRK